MIENYYEFLYFWVNEAVIFMCGVGLGISVVLLKTLKNKKSRSNTNKTTK